MSTTENKTDLHGHSTVGCCDHAGRQNRCRCRPAVRSRRHRAAAEAAAPTAGRSENAASRRSCRATSQRIARISPNHIALNTDLSVDDARASAASSPPPVPPRRPMRCRGHECLAAPGSRSESGRRPKRPNRRAPRGSWRTTPKATGYSLNWNPDLLELPQ